MPMALFLFVQKNLRNASILGIKINATTTEALRILCYKTRLSHLKCILKAIHSYEKCGIESICHITVFFQNAV